MQSGSKLYKAGKKEKPTTLLSNWLSLLGYSDSNQE